MRIDELITITANESHNDPRNPSFGAYLITQAILELKDSIDSLRETIWMKESK
jgi:hypothetical protein